MTGFKKIYKQHFIDVYKYTLYICRNESIVEEVTQKNFFKAMQHIERFNVSCKIADIITFIIFIM